MNNGFPRATARWPVLDADFVGPPESVRGTLGLGMAMPPGRCAAPVFDVQTRLAVIAGRRTDGKDQLILAFRLRQLAADVPAAHSRTD
jgi:hypothetical protein